MERFVIALGFFDSLHIGHMSLLEKTKALALELKAEPLALTFDDDFFPVLNKDIKQVFTLWERQELLKKVGVRAFVAASKDVFLLTGNAFLSYLKSLGVVGIVAGEDYRYGHMAASDIKDLSLFCKENNIKLIVAPTIMQEGRKISSSSIRELLTIGDIAKVNALLGREYTITGKVKSGRGEGRKMGLPTANIYTPTIKHLPKEGVYRTYTLVDGKRYDSVTSVGGQPTFESSVFSVETLIIGFSGNLYDNIITVGFLNWMREMIKFNSKEALIEQISMDIEEAKNG